MSATAPLGAGPRDARINLDALPTEKQFQEVWDALSHVEEFGTDVVFHEAMDAVITACESASLFGEPESPAGDFDLSSVTWESVGRLSLYVQDTRSTLGSMLANVEKIAESIPILLEHLHTGGEHDIQPRYDRYGGEYSHESELIYMAQAKALAERA